MQRESSYRISRNDKPVEISKISKIINVTKKNDTQDKTKEKGE